MVLMKRAVHKGGSGLWVSRMFAAILSLQENLGGCVLRPAWHLSGLLPFAEGEAGEMKGYVCRWSTSG